MVHKFVSRSINLAESRLSFFQSRIWTFLTRCLLFCRLCSTLLYWCKGL